MKITNQKVITSWEITGLPPGEYDLTVIGHSPVGDVQAVVHESIPEAAPETPVVEP